MVEIELKLLGKRAVGFTAKGHAMYADSGEDIVCSAISALTQTALLGLLQEISVNADYSIDDDGYISCMIKDVDEDMAEKADLILRVMYRGLCSIKENYGKYLSVSEREVTI